MKLAVMPVTIPKPSSDRISFGVGQGRRMINESHSNPVTIGNSEKKEMLLVTALIFIPRLPDNTGDSCVASISTPNTTITRITLRRSGSSGRL